MTDSSDTTTQTPPVYEPSVQATSEGRLDKAARTLPRRRFFSDMPDKGLFAAIALTGFIGIIVAKTQTPMAAQWIAAISVAAMIFYGFGALQMPAVQIRPDRLGDNFYYLGFIYTLASLSAALIQLGDVSNIEDLLGSFGIALVTTIVGVVGRVLFVQMRGEIDEIEDHIRRDLLAASADLRAQLSLALAEFETFRVAIFQASDATLKATTEQATSHVAQIGSLAQSAAKESSNALQRNREQAERLGELMDRIERAIGALPLLGKIELPSERLEQQIATFTQRFEALIAQLQEAMNEYGHRVRRRRRWYWPFRR